MEGEDLVLVKEAISSLTLELDRVNEFSQDIKTITPIIDKGVKWQIDAFQSMGVQEMREMRRLFTNVKPKVKLGSREFIILPI